MYYLGIASLNILSIWFGQHECWIEKQSQRSVFTHLILGSPCEHEGVCVNIPGSYRCDCPTGFSGPRCEANINECESNPCQNEGTCIDERGGYRCLCMPGKSLRIFCYYFLALVRHYQRLFRLYYLFSFSIL